MCLRNVTRLHAGMRPAGVSAHFSGPLSLLFLVVECSPRPRLACSVHLRLQAKTVMQANRMRFETPATPHTCSTDVSRIIDVMRHTDQDSFASSAAALLSH